MKSIVPIEVIENKILVIRGQKVMLDKDLAVLYNVDTKLLKRSVMRNVERFPGDFMLRINRQEMKNLRCQFGTSSWGGTRYLPLAFTEQGVAMLSSILNSKRAIAVNIQIMRTFTKLRELLSEHADLRRKIDEMERKYDHQFAVVFDAIKKLLTPPRSKKKVIGFRP